MKKPNKTPQFVIFLIFILFSTGNGQYIFKKLMMVPYGNSENQISIRKEPDGTYGPASFFVDEKSVYILDSENNRIKIFSKEGTLLKNITIPAFSQDFGIKDNFIYVLNHENILSAIDILNAQIFEDISIPKVTRFPYINMFLSGNTIELESANEESVLYSIETSSKLIKKPEITQTKKSKIQKLNQSEALLQNTNNLFNPATSFIIKESQNNLASVQLLNTDQEGNYYLDEECFITEVPCKVNRFLLKYSKNGEFQSKIKLPIIYYCKLDHDIRISPEGNIYHLLANKNGLEVICWEKVNFDFQVPEIRYPEEYKNEYHYNHEIFERKEDGTTNPNPASSQIGTTGTRDESIKIGDTYVNHNWTCNSNNLTVGAVRAPDGKQIQTPDWIVIGTNSKVPYQWGGFSTISDFDQGLTRGKYAGDNICSGNGSSSAVGVDCSGFVSRCWKLSSHYSTSMMPSIMIPLSSWTYLRKGDAIHIVGHVRMSIDNNPNGTVNLVESSGKDWRVSYRTYTFTALSGYSPYKYKNIQESATEVQNTIAVDKNLNLSCYPNPFNLSTTINFDLQSPAFVNIQIIDYLGKSIKTIVIDKINQGSHQYYWDGKNNKNLTVATGCYLCLIKALTIDGENKIIQKKIILSK